MGNFDPVQFGGSEEPHRLSGIFRGFEQPRFILLEVDGGETVDVVVDQPRRFERGVDGGGDLLRRGVAAGTAAVTTEGTQLMTKETYESLLGRVVIERV